MPHLMELIDSQSRDVLAKNLVCMDLWDVSQNLLRYAHVKTKEREELIEVLKRDGIFEKVQSEKGHYVCDVVCLKVSTAEMRRIRGIK